MDAARRIQYEDDAPAVEPMRAQRRQRTNPSREDIKVRRRLERAHKPAQVRTAALRCLACGCQGRGAPQGSRCPACGSLAIVAGFGPAYAETDWDETLPHIEDIHRGIGVTLPDEVHRIVHDPNRPVHERAHALINYIKTDPDKHVKGLGQHWSSSQGVAEDFAEKRAKYLTGEEFKRKRESGDESDEWGRFEDEFDHDALQDHLMEHHHIPEHLLTGNLEREKAAHDFMHSDDKKWADYVHGTNQMTLPGMEHGKLTRSFPAGHTHDNFVERGEPHAKPATAVVFTTGQPAREDIHEEPTGEGGDIYNYWNHGEEEVPLRKGAHVPIKAVHWMPVDDERYDLPEKYTSHHFGEDDHYHHAKKATVLRTQIERANGADERGNGGDMMRTPQGQTVRILKVRPHETEQGKVYVDTDMGTSIMNRGTDVELVPHNVQQQELPGSGIPGGNVGHLPGAGRGSGGEGSTGQAPHCPVDGAKMRFRNNAWVCPVDGTTAPTGSAPSGMSPVDWGRGHLIDRERNRGVPQTHMWASKYNTIDRPPMAAEMSKRVLSTMEGNR